MKLTISDCTDMTRALEEWTPPSGCEEVIIDCPEVRRFTNCFLNSNINCRVRVQPTTNNAVSYAGMFSGCKNLNSQPFMDTTKCINMAAMFKDCREMRFSTHWMDTSNVRDMRQMFMNCQYFYGNGPAYFDFSSLSNPDAMTHFAYGTKFNTRYYDQIILNLFKQADSGKLPTPMNRAHFGAAQYSPIVADERVHLVDYGWDIIDGGQVDIELSPLEVQLSQSVDDRLERGDFPGSIDLSPICRSARGGVAITPRHTMHVRHYMPAVGQTIRFWNGEEAVVKSCRHGGWDIAIATLDRDVNITPALVMRDNWRELLPNSLGPPSSYPAGTSPALLVFNRNSQIGIWDLSYIDNKNPQAQPNKAAKKIRSIYHMGMALGDSGSPVCFVYKDRLIAGFAVSTSNGNGIWLSGVLDWANEIIGQTGHHFTYLELDE